MILAIRVKGVTAYFCDKPDCLTEAVRVSKPNQQVTRAAWVPMTAICNGCGHNLYDMRVPERLIDALFAERVKVQA